MSTMTSEQISDLSFRAEFLQGELELERAKRGRQVEFAREQIAERDDRINDLENTVARVLDHLLDMREEAEAVMDDKRRIASALHMGQARFAKQANANYVDLGDILTSLLDRG